MPLVIPLTDLATGYTAATSFGGGGAWDGGYIVIANNPAALQYQVRSEGVWGLAGSWSQEIYAPPGVYPIIGGGRQSFNAIRLRNYVAGSVARVAGVAYFPGEARLGTVQPLNVSVAAGGGTSPFSGIPCGTAFPTSPPPAACDMFLRSDLLGGMLFVYDGTRWLSQPQIKGFELIDAVLFGAGLAATTAPAGRFNLALNDTPPPGTAWQTYAHAIQFGNLVVAPNNGGNRWDYTFTLVASGVVIGTHSSVGSGAGVWDPLGVTLGQLITQTDTYISLGITKVGAPGNLFMSGCDLVYSLTHT